MLIKLHNQCYSLDQVEEDFWSLTILFLPSTFIGLCFLVFIIITIIMIYLCLKLNYIILKIVQIFERRFQFSVTK